MSSERLPSIEDGVSRWLCPSCAAIISGPGYPKLHICSNGESLTVPTRRKVMALKKIIDGQADLLLEKTIALKNELDDCKPYAGAMQMAKAKDKAIALLNSMVCGGEPHSDTSRKIVSEALHREN